MHSDHRRYVSFAAPARVEKAISTLSGIVYGITADRTLNKDELAHLHAWVDEHMDVADRHPFSELVATLESALKDGVITEDERDDLLWLCRRLQVGDYYCTVTRDMQSLHGVLSGVASDGIVCEKEARALSDWLEAHDHLKTLWPYDEVETLITRALADGRIDPEEQREMLGYFAQFTYRGDDRTIDAKDILVKGLCAVDPLINFDGRQFCLTGASSRYTRSSFAAVIADAGGKVAQGVSKNTHYLVVGAEGNPCWSYACYGRKVEKAIELRRAGYPVVIVQELDLHDALADF